MKKITKVISVLLVLALFAAMAIGSGSDKEEKQNEVKTPSSVTSDSQTIESTATDPKTADEKKTEPKATEKAKQKATEKPSATIEEAILLDRDGIKVTAKSLDMKGSFYGPELKMLFENNSGKNVTIQARNTSVNGYMIEPMMSVDVASGKKANDSMSFSTSDLTAAGITTIADIEFMFHVFDSETWNDLFNSDTVKIETSVAKEYNYTFDNSGTQAFNDKGVEIVIKGLAKEDSWLGKELVVYIHNDSNRNVTIQARDVSVNGFMVDPVFSCDIAPGKHAIDTITFMSSDLEKNEIKSIESVELSFHIFDGDTWNDIVDTPVVTINFN